MLVFWKVFKAWEKLVLIFIGMFIWPGLHSSTLYLSKQHLTIFIQEWILHIYPSLYPFHCEQFNVHLTFVHTLRMDFDHNKGTLASPYNCFFSSNLYYSNNNHNLGTEWAQKRDTITQCIFPLDYWQTIRDLDAQFNKITYRQRVSVMDAYWNIFKRFSSISLLS